MNVRSREADGPFTAPFRLFNDTLAMADYGATAPIALLFARAEISNLLKVPLYSAPVALQCASSHRALRLWRVAWEKDHA